MMHPLTHGIAFNKHGNLLPLPITLVGLMQAVFHGVGQEFPPEVMSCQMWRWSIFKTFLSRPLTVAAGNRGCQQELSCHSWWSGNPPWQITPNCLICNHIDWGYHVRKQRIFEQLEVVYLHSAVPLGESQIGQGERILHGSEGLVFESPQLSSPSVCQSIRWQWGTWSHLLVFPLYLNRLSTNYANNAWLIYAKEL